MGREKEDATQLGDVGSVSQLVLSRLQCGQPTHPQVSEGQGLRESQFTIWEQVVFRAHQQRVNHCLAEVPDLLLSLALLKGWRKCPACG